MQVTFTTVLKNTQDLRQVWIQGINEYLNLSEDNDIDTTPTITVHWTFGIDDAREWGVKEFLLRIDKVVIDIDWDYTDEEDGYHYGNIPIIVNYTRKDDLKPTDFEIINNMELHKDKFLCPNNIEIDLSTNRSIEIS